MNNEMVENQFFKISLSLPDFRRLSEFITRECGIKLPEGKRNLVESRLRKRLIENNVRSYSDYCDIIFNSPKGKEEIIYMIDAVTTNKTDFFRENVHFDFLRESVLPQYSECNLPLLKIWSAACSSGEEVYSISITLNEYFSTLEKKQNYNILGTDISTDMIAKASAAVYNEERIIDIPLEIKKKYFLKSKDSNLKKVRVVPEIRKHTQFRPLNFMDKVYSAPSDFDIIFCRNALIYFDRPTQECVINKLCAHLKKDGYFFLGHSESIIGINVPLKQLKPAVFKKI